MKTIDLRFDNNMLEMIKSMAGKIFDSFKSSPFLITESVPGVVFIKLSDGKSYAFTNEFEVLDYFGDVDDFAVFRLEPFNYNNTWTPLKDKRMVTTPIGGKIIKIRVVNETQKLYRNETLESTFCFTRGVVFSIEDGLEVAFEKDIGFLD